MGCITRPLIVVLLIISLFFSVHFYVKQDHYQDDLREKDAAIESLESQLSDCESSLDAAQKEIDDVSLYLDQEKSSVAILEDENAQLKEDLSSCKNAAKQAQDEIDSSLKNPTWAEMMAFILIDMMSYETPENLPENYNCVDYSGDMIKRAAGYGYFAQMVYMDYENSNKAHMVVGFNTTDEGLIYVEPQTHEIIELEIGGTYEDKVISKIVPN